MCVFPRCDETNTGPPVCCWSCSLCLKRTSTTASARCWRFSRGPPPLSPPFPSLMESYCLLPPTVWVVSQTLLSCVAWTSCGSIVNGFCVPIKDEHKVMLVRALIPLHKVLYAPSRQYLWSLFASVDAKPDDHWATECSLAAVLFRVTLKDCACGVMISAFTSLCDYDNILVRLSTSAWLHLMNALWTSLKLMCVWWRACVCGCSPPTCPCTTHSCPTAWCCTCRRTTR